MCSRLGAVALMVAGLSLAFTGATHAAGPRPDFDLPFPCGQRWRATTYGGHKGIDWNWGVGSDDLGKPVVASAPGIATARYMSGLGYYVQINHGRGWVTQYAHLLGRGRARGMVARGERIGFVGSTGHSTGPHLHWVQLADGAWQPTHYAGGAAVRADGRTITSTNCGRPDPFASDEVHRTGTKDMVSRFIGSGGASRVRVVKGARSRSLEASTAMTTTATQLPPTALLAVGDTTGDGATDLNAAVARRGGTRFVTFPATGSGEFARRRSRLVASRWRIRDLRELHAGDVNGNGTADLVARYVPPTGRSTIRVVRGRSRRVLTGRIATRPTRAELPAAALLAVGDTDGDGRHDLNAALPYRSGTRLVTFSGTSRGTFSTRRVRLTARWDLRSLTDLRAGDVDGDGIDDLIGRFQRRDGSSIIRVVRGARRRLLTARIARRPTLTALPARARIAVGDTNANGRADLNAVYASRSGVRYVTFPGRRTAALGARLRRHADQTWDYSRMR